MSDWKACGLEERGKYERAARRFERTGDFGDAARCWVRCKAFEKGLSNLEKATSYRAEDSVIPVAKYLIGQGDVRRAGDLLLRKAGMEEFTSLLDELVNCRVTQTPLRECLWEWLATARTHSWGRDRLCDHCHILGIAAVKLAPADARSFIRDDWDVFISDVESSIDDDPQAPITVRVVSECKEIFVPFPEEDPFIGQIVDSLMAVFSGRQERLSREHFVILPQRLLESDGSPFAAARYCEAALESRLSAHPTWGWGTSEACWHELLSEAYLKLGKHQEALELYRSRRKYGEVAEILALTGRHQEAIELLEASGPALFSRRSWYNTTVDPEAREWLWKEEISRLRGEVAAEQVLAADTSVQGNDESTSMRELDQMFALGEVTATEYERMKGGLEGEIDEQSPEDGEKRSDAS